MKKLIYITLVMCLPFSCGKKNACFKGAGKIETKEILELSFHEIYLYDNIDLELKQGINTSILIESGENLIPFIETSIVNEVLTLKNNNKCSFLRNQKSAVKIVITSPNIDQLNYYGTGEIESKDTLYYPVFKLDCWEGIGDVNLIFNSDSIEIKEHIGISDMYISGKSNSAYYYLTTLGNFHCQGLISKYAQVNNSGNGDINLYAEDELLIDKNSGGDVNYWGNPTVTILKNEGTGSINKR